jgi:hypothetical protein
MKQAHKGKFVPIDFAERIDGDNESPITHMGGGRYDSSAPGKQTAGSQEVLAQKAFDDLRCGELSLNS